MVNYKYFIEFYQYINFRPFTCTAMLKALKIMCYVFMIPIFSLVYHIGIIRLYMISGGVDEVIMRLTIRAANHQFHQFDICFFSFILVTYFCCLHAWYYTFFSTVTRRRSFVVSTVQFMSSVNLSLVSAAVSRISGYVVKCETGQNNRQEETRAMNERGSVFWIDGFLVLGKNMKKNFSTRFFPTSSFNNAVTYI